MKRIAAHRLGILQGSRVLFTDFVDGGVMWTGEGPRECRFIVTFREPFAEPPAVTLGLTMWDMDHQANSRADITAEAITATGFHIVFRTWGDTRVARVRADWMALGPLPDEDAWEVD